MVSPESNLNIVAMGGGGAWMKAQRLLRHAVAMTGVEHKPQVLLIATPKRTQESFDKAVGNTLGLFRDDMGLPTTVLHGFESMPNQSEITEKIEAANLIYISGGDTDHMMTVWKRHGIDTLLKRRATEGLVISGISAGAIASFEWGHSDSLSYRVEKGEPWEYIAVNGLGMVHAAVTPHYNTFPAGKSRAESFHQMLLNKQHSEQAFGIDNSAGLIIEAGVMRAGSVVTGATVHIIESHLEDMRVSTHPLDASIF